MVEAAEALYGPYAWGRWDTIVLPPSFPFGGMENPRLTFATPTIIAGDRSLVDVMAHELAHSWSGNLVTNATWSDFWLNEGFTTYIENRIVEGLYGKDLAEMEVLLPDPQAARDAWRRASGRARGDTQLAQELSGRDPDDGRRRRVREGRELPARAREALRPRAVRRVPARLLRRQRVPQHDHGRFLELLRAGLFEDEPRPGTTLRVEEWVYGRGIPDNLVVPALASASRTRGLLPRPS